MRKVVFLSTALSIAGWCAVVQAQTHPEETIDATNVVWQLYGYDVYPTGTAAIDTANIQWAVDHVASVEESEPGTVRLKSHAAGDADGFLAFDFGPPPETPAPGWCNVYICNDVQIEGEIRSDTYTTDNTTAEDPLLGEHRMTEIHNGWANFGVNWWLTPFLCNLETCPECCGLPTCEEGFADIVRMRNLVIRNTTYLALWVGSGLEFPEDGPSIPHFLSEVAVDNLRIVDVNPDPSWLSTIPFIFHMDFGTLTIRNSTISIAETEETMVNHVGIAINTMLTGPWEEEPDNPWIGPLHLEISGNELVVPSARDGSFGMVLWAPVDAVVTGNRIRAGLGIGAMIRHHGTIADNELVVTNAGFAGIRHAPLDPPVELPPSELPAGVVVRGNQVTLDPSGSRDIINPSTGVLGLFSAHIEGPDCWMGSTTDTVFQENLFVGTAEYGVYFGDIELDGCEELSGSDTVADVSQANTFASNDFSGLVASVAQVYLGEGATNNRLGDDQDDIGNLFGPIEQGATAAIEVLGDDNRFFSDTYDLTGWPEDTPIWLFRETSGGNTVRDPILPDCVDPADYFVDEGTGNHLIAEMVCPAEEGEGTADTPPDVGPDAQTDTSPDAGGGAEDEGCDCSAAATGARRPAAALFALSLLVVLVGRRRSAR
ncbi:MAG: hypothetical protein JW797_13515 [Bradymonadales bacterium]|nr:hypothetical protein [Bradymonadales bacterium]